MGQSASAAEYTDYFSAAGYDSPTSALSLILNNLIVSLQ